MGFLYTREVAGSYGFVLLFFFFSFLRNLHTVLHHACTKLHSHQQCRRVPLSPHPFQNLLLENFLVMAILNSVRWYFTVVLICISLVLEVLSIFSCVCWPSVCLLWRNVYWEPLHTFFNCIFACFDYKYFFLNLSFGSLYVIFIMQNIIIILLTDNIWQICHT